MMTLKGRLPGDESGRFEIDLNKEASVKLQMTAQGFRVRQPIGRAAQFNEMADDVQRDVDAFRRLLVRRHMGSGSRRKIGVSIVTQIENVYRRVHHGR